MVFDLRSSGQPDRFGAFTPVCGLPILTRNLLLLARAGIGRGLLLVGSDETAARLSRELLRQPRLAAMTLKSAFADDAMPLLPQIDREIQALGTGLRSVLYWPGETSCGIALPAVATAAVPPGGAAACAGADPDSPVLVSRDALASSSACTVGELISTLRAGRRIVEVEDHGAPIAVRSASDRSRASAILLQSLRKKADGAFSSRFNRRVSLAVTSVVSRLPVTPNQATFLSGLVGVASGLLAAAGGYWWLLLGALAYLASNILDGVDGEIARAKLQESGSGQWLDTIADDVTNLAFCTGTAIGCARTWHSQLYLGLGAAIAVGLFVTAAIMYRYLLTVAHCGDLNAFKWPWKSGDGGAHPPSSKWLHRAELIIKRDAFAYWALLSALFGEARIALWLAAAGANAAWIAWAFYSLARAGSPREAGI